MKPADQDLHFLEEHRGYRIMKEVMGTVYILGQIRYLNVLPFTEFYESKNGVFV